MAVRAFELPTGTGSIYASPLGPCPWFGTKPVTFCGTIWDECFRPPLCPICFHWRALCATIAGCCDESGTGNKHGIHGLVLFSRPVAVRVRVSWGDLWHHPCCAKPRRLWLKERVQALVYVAGKFIALGLERTCVNSNAKVKYGSFGASFLRL